MIKDISIRLRIARRNSAMRRARGLTQKQLAEKLGIPQQNISRIERGEHALLIDNLARIAFALNYNEINITSSWRQEGDFNSTGTITIIIMLINQHITKFISIPQVQLQYLLRSLGLHQLIHFNSTDPITITKVVIIFQYCADFFTTC